MPPLDGVRVLDLSRVLAGPYCTMVLADLGADVIKVERPGVGDETRAWGPPYAGGESAYYISVNRGKRSCAIDLSTEEGQRQAQELAARLACGDRELPRGHGGADGARLRGRGRSQPDGGLLLDHRVRIGPRAARAAGL